MKYFLVLLFCVSLHAADVASLNTPFFDHFFFVDEVYLNTISGAKGGSQRIDAPGSELILTTAPEEHSTTLGGSATNVMKSLSHLGHFCHLFGPLGTDSDSTLYLSLVEAHGLIPHFYCASNLVGHVFCLITPDGERTMRTYLPTKKSCEPHFLHQQDFENVALLHIEGYQLNESAIVERAIGLAKQNRALISFDLASFEVIESFRDEIVDLLSHSVDVVFMNAVEAYTLTGLQPDEACKKVSKQVPIVAVTMGSQGCWLAARGIQIHIDAVPVPVLDTTGAGDLFAAGVLHGILTGLPLKQAGELGTFLASRVIQRLGTELSPLDWQEALSLMQKAHVGNDNEIGMNTAAKDLLYR